MIGVAVPAAEREIVQEFFELLKTPWEYYQSGQRYDVLLCTLADWKPNGAAKLSLIYSGKKTVFDEINKIPLSLGGNEGTAFLYENRRLPIYGQNVVFPANDYPLFKENDDGASLSYLTTEHGGSVVRLGYDLFWEVRHLLTAGQPPANAGTPALELHIALLRELITRSGIPLVEIPPVPDGYNLMGCLTHDLDHPALRNHCCDHTMIGFLCRATVGSLVQVCRGRESIKALCQNWAAAGKLPFVFLGMAKDPWGEFDRYLEFEAGLGSTYFVIPQKGYAGRHTKGGAPSKRAAWYTVAEIKPQLERITARGGEIGLHGLDAWLDSASGSAERRELARTLGPAAVGVRMHWLFLDENSAAHLERAGFSYDSSVGYNETVGYRAGTAQAYKPLGAVRLLELPLLVMDTALFFPQFLNLSKANAERLVWGLLDDASRFGGVLTINWHDRSIAPERLWADFYFKLLGELKRRGAWFPTAAQAVSWFRKRRSVTFGPVSWEEGQVSLSASASADLESPGLRVRVHCARTRNLHEKPPHHSCAAFIDLGFNTNLQTKLSLPVLSSKNDCGWLSQTGGSQPPLEHHVSAI